MKRTGLIFGLLCGFVVGSAYPYYRIDKDSTDQPGKEFIERALIELRDSIDNTIISLEKRQTSHVNYSREQVNVAYDELMNQRREIEDVIEEVVAAGAYNWDQEIRSRALFQISKQRKAYYKILHNIKEAASAKI
jgi:hypothetical protein